MQNPTPRGMTLLVAQLLSPRVLRPLFWALALFALTMALLPHPPHTPIDRFGDKFEHMFAFAVLAGVAALGWREVRGLRLLLALSLFGAGIEVMQALPALHRDSDVRDWIADTAAALAVLGTIRFVIRRRRAVPIARPLD
jgi:VanZ family protein